MPKTAVIIPNYNGIKYLKACLNSLKRQSVSDFDIIVVDNDSTDGSAYIIEKEYPEIKLIKMTENLGFSAAVNAGIKACRKHDYVILLNNDTVAGVHFVEELERCIEKDERIFSCQAKMLRNDQPKLLDDGGDFYCALGWAFARGKDRPASSLREDTDIFYSCAGAAIYRVSILKEIGIFDDRQFAYLEDCDIGWRARIHGYRNVFASRSVVKHVGSASSGSRHNEFKVKNSAPNSIYIIYKNMPILQIIINIPFLLAGFLIKTLFFTVKGLGVVYVKGLRKGFSMCLNIKNRGRKVRFAGKNFRYYLKIQLELWINTLRKVIFLFK
ncbi:MAG: glycosyltransferase family 2 protein [Lachnospiraceae bacterium]|jgi:GT2 family glycosyltransferase